MRNTITIGIAGLGEWGPKLLRNFLSCPTADVRYICDLSEQRLKRWSSFSPAGIIATPHFDDLLKDNELQAVAIATPASLHYEQARQALMAGKDLLVEKPLCSRLEQAQELAELATKQARILMVGHTFLYNPAVRRIKQSLEQGELGKLFFVTAQRLSLGRVREDINVLWNLAPHDVSILLYWMAELPEWVQGVGASYLQSPVEDVVFFTLGFKNGTMAQVELSWLNPSKIRRMCLVGSKKMLVYDDVSVEGKVAIYDQGVELEETSDESFGEFQTRVRRGDVHIPRVDFVEPLKLEVEHFLECVQSRTEPMTGPNEAVQVTRIISAIEQSITQQGNRVYLNDTR